MACSTHIVAIPIPASGHVNPMMNLCRLLAERGINITFVITEDWKSVTSLEQPPLPNIQIRTIPNVVPFELELGTDFIGFWNALRTNMEAPVEQLFDQLNLPIHGILADSFISWTVAFGRRRNIKVFSLFTQSAAVFTVFLHHHLLEANVKLPVDLSERGEELVNYIPGIGSSTTLADIPSICFNEDLANIMKDDFEWITKTDCVVVPSSFELEPNVIDWLKSNFTLPIYPVGPLIPYHIVKAKEDMSIVKPISTNHEPTNYYTWLDSQPKNSVLLISFGTFFPVSGQQKEEVATALRESKVRYLWIVRGNSKSVQLMDDNRGLVVSWCEQLNVLRHPSVGSFLTHCGWNSVLEGVYAGVPMLAFPVNSDQFSNSKLIVDDLKVGLRLKRQTGKEVLVKSESITHAIQMIMDVNGGSRTTEMQERAKKLQELCHASLREGGSSYCNLVGFFRHVIGQLN